MEEIAYRVVYENYGVPLDSSEKHLRLLRAIRKIWETHFFYRNKLMKQLIKDGYYTKEGLPTKQFFQRGEFVGKLAKRGNSLFNFEV